MNVPPMILDLKIDSRDQRPVHLWLPLFLLWPLVLALAVISLVLTICVDVVLLLLGQRYHHYTVLLARLLAALTETRGMVIRVNDDQATFDMTIQ